jgi:uncharacterized protein (TIGR01777 family)
MGFIQSDNIIRDRMKYNKIILAGGSGYLGSVLAEHFKPFTKDIVILSRKMHAVDGNVRTVVWNGRDKGAWISEIEGAELLVNLCGKNVNCRYTEKNKREIIRSRVEPTVLLGSVISSFSSPPPVWINVTSATIYRHAEDYGQDEATGQTGYGFSIDVCKKWEEAFDIFELPATRKIKLRMAIVFGRKDGVFPRLLNLVKFGLGGKQGNGSQMVSWIHEQDAARIIEWMIDHPMEGVINCSAPGPIRNDEMMKCIRRAYGVPFGFPAPQWLLGIGAVLIGTETELILKSRWVLPARLQKEGYPFLFTSANHAIHDLLSTTTK